MDASTIVEVVKFELHKDWVDDESDDQVWLLDTYAITIEGIPFIARTEHDGAEEAFEEIRRICAI